MSKSDILSELPKLGRGERWEILEKIWAIEEADLRHGGPLLDGEKDLLDRELKEFQSNPDAGSPWNDVEARLRQSLRQ